MASWWDSMEQFYFRNFPTDITTVAATFSIISVVFSSLNLVLLTYYMYRVSFFVLFAIISIFTLVTGWLTVQLYYGLYIGDKKFTSMWILLKIVENLSAVVLLAWAAVTYSFNRYYNYNFDAVLPGVVFIIFHVVYVVFVVQKARATPLGHLEDLCATTTPFIKDKSDVSIQNESPVTIN